MKSIYQVEGMKCASCITKIKNALERYTESVEITFDPPQVILEEKGVDLDTLNTALKKAGPYKLMSWENTTGSTPETKKQQQSWIHTYRPLLVIVAMITISSFAGAADSHQWMLHFMAGFFLVFGSFKLFDVKGFRNAYATYDLIAKYWCGYGYVYPFLELGLGFAFLFQVGITQALWFSLILMSFSSLGVIKAVVGKQKIRCACLGTTLHLPMSTITLFEDLGMVLMSIAMLMQT